MKKPTNTEHENFSANNYEKADQYWAWKFLC